MERRRTQLMFNFLPDDTFNHSDNGTIGRIWKLWGDRESDVDDLPIGLILNRLNPHLNKWENDVHIDEIGVDIKEPSGAVFELFPRTFECQCGACTQFSQGEIERGIHPECGHCSNQLQDTDQLPFVLVCKCGELEDLPIPNCSSCGYQHPELRRKTSRLEDAYWYCPACETQFTDTAYQHIDPCYCGQGRRIKVHSSSTTFYPQSEDFVNIAESDYEAVTRSEEYQREVIANFLVQRSGLTASSEESLDEELQELLDKRGITIEEYAAQLGIDPEQLKEGSKQATQHSADQHEEALAWVEQTFEDQGRKRETVSEELFEYRSIIGEEGSGAESETFETLVDHVDERPNLSKRQLERYQDLRSNLNLSEVRLIDDFPITSVVYGYSRLANGPEDGVQLNTFDDPLGGNQQLFAQTAKEEAIMLSLDREQVIQWLLDNDVLDRWPEMDIERWCLTHLTNYTRYEPIEPGENGTEIQRYVLTLLHSLSHAGLNAIDALSGYSRESMVEYLLPHTLSLIIYKRSRTDYSIGAMHTLFEDRFDEVHDHIQTDSDLCMYDPVCERSEGASCEGCIYVPNLSCAAGNANLARTTLHGGRFDDEEITGYLHV